MKKKIIYIILCIMVIMSLIGCGSSNTSTSKETEEETEDTHTLTKTEYIKLAKETGYRAAIDLTYLTQLAGNEMIYAKYAETMTDEILDSASETMEEYFGINKYIITMESGDISVAYNSYLNNIPDDEAQEWYDAISPLCKADASLYSATYSLDKYESASELTSAVSEITDSINDLINEFYQFESANPVAGTDFHEGYFFTYPDEWWTKTSEDGKYYYIYPEEDTAAGMIMMFYTEMGYKNALTNVAKGAQSIEETDSVVEVESNTGTSVSGFDASEIIYTQMVNDVEYSTDAYVIATQNIGVFCVSLIVPKDSTADYSDGFNEVIDSLVYTGIDWGE